MVDESSFDNMAEINVTPMIDVLLSLLIIFMVAAPPPPNEQQPIAIPKDPVTEQPDNPEATLLITILDDGKIMLGKTELADDFDVIVDKLKANKKAQADGRVAITASNKVPYGKVILVMAAAREAGIPSVGIASDRL